MTAHFTFDKSSPALAALGLAMSVGCFGSSPALADYTKVSSGIFSGHAYEVWRKDSGRLTWSEAQAYASSVLGGNLVSINSDEENSFVAGLIKDPSLYSDSNSPALNYQGPYIGLKRTGSTTTPVDTKVGWSWLDGSTLSTSDSLWSKWFATGMTYAQPDGMNGDNVGVFYNATNGLQGPYGMAGSPVVTWGDVFDGWTISSGPHSPGPNPHLANSFIIEKVPGPLPVMGAFAALRWSRFLRRRRVANRSI